MPYGFNKNQFDGLIGLFSHFSEIKEVVVFGSRAMGNYKKGSDVDLALKGDIDERLVRKVSVELNEISTLPYIFDVISYNTISNSNLKKHIDEFGKSLYRRSVVG